jgi:hypothetical protein
MANEHLAQPAHREMALEFYRLNLHGTGWKIEIGDFKSALEMLDTAVKSCTKAREFDHANKYKSLRSRVAGYAKQAARHKAA